MASTNMHHHFERNDLYEEVWRTPMTTLAAKYGLSDNGLRKVCKAMNIPLPPVGHWAKLAAGKPVGKRALPTHAERTSFNSHPPPPRQHVDLSDQAWLNDRLAFEARKENRIVVPAVTEVWHKAIAPLRPAIEAAVKRRQREIVARDKAAALRSREARRGRSQLNTDYFKYKHLESPVLLHARIDGCLRVTEDTAMQALDIMNALFFALEQRGFSVGIEKDGGRFQVVLSATSFQILLRERQSGELAFNVSRPALTEMIVVGSADDKLEGQLNRFICRLYRSIVAAREQQEEWRLEAEHRRLSEAAAKARAIQAEQEAAERAVVEARRKTLCQEALEWHQAEQLRAYVAAVASKHPESAPWQAWALSVADGMDPLNAETSTFRQHPGCRRPTPGDADQPDRA